jgi:hypothetical protein
MHMPALICLLPEDAAMTCNTVVTLSAYSFGPGIDRALIVDAVGVRFLFPRPDGHGDEYGIHSEWSRNRPYEPGDTVGHIPFSADGCGSY